MNVIKFFTVILLAVIMAAGLLLFHYSKIDAMADNRRTAQNIIYHHYFINPKDGEINVLDLDETGKIARLRQLTFDQYPKSHLEVFYDNKLIGYFQNINKNGEMNRVSKDEYYKNYVKLMIKRGENGEPEEIYRGDVHTSYWEWSDKNRVIVYYGCGTHCMYYYLININNKKVEGEGYVYE